MGECNPWQLLKLIEGKVSNIVGSATLLARQSMKTEPRGNSVIDPADYLSDDEVLARWPKLTRAELRRARKANPPQIGFLCIPQRTCFTPSQVHEYINRTTCEALKRKGPHAPIPRAAALAHELFSLDSPWI
jgi:hypothetical protein